MTGVGQLLVRLGTNDQLFVSTDAKCLDGTDLCEANDEPRHRCLSVACVFWRCAGVSKLPVAEADYAAWCYIWPINVLSSLTSVVHVAA